MSNKIETATEDALYASMRQILNHLGWEKLQVVLANEGGLEPKGSYALINIIDRQRVGRVDESTGSPRNQESINTYSNYYTLSIQISFVGSESGDVMGDFEDSVFSSRRCIEYWQMHKLGPLSQSGSRRVPQLRETKWVKAYNIDLNLSFAIQSRETIDWIEFFTYEDTYGFTPPSP